MEKLGIEPKAFFTQIFNFVLMVFLLSRFLYRPVMKTLEERKKKIEEGLRFRKEMEEKLLQAESLKKEILEKAKEEARKIVNQGKITGKKLEEEIVKEAEKKAKEILERGKKELEAYREELERELKRKTVDLAEVMTKELLQEILDERKHREIIQRKIEEIVNQKPRVATSS